MQVRMPRFTEIMDVVALGAFMVEESEQRFINYDPKVAYHLVRSTLERAHDADGRFIVVAVDDAGVLCGFMMGGLVNYPWSGDYFAVDNGIFVTKERRGSRAAKLMLDAFEEWAKDNGAKEISVGVSTGVEPERTHRFYGKMGYNHVGGVYRKRTEV